MNDDLRDETLAGLYREAPGAAPPEHLDREILSASRRAVDAGARPASPFSGRWQVPVALAAVLLVSVLLVPLVSDRMDEPVTPGAVAPGEALREAAPGSGQAEMRKRRLPAPEADAVAPRRELLETPAVPNAEIRRSRPSAPGKEASEKERPASMSVGDMNRAVTYAETDWLKRIRRLLQAGDEAEALEQLQAFTRQYPDYALPEELQAFRKRQAETRR